MLPISQSALISRVAFVVMAVLCRCGMAQQAGSMDAAFGTNGVSLLSLPDYSVQANAVVIDADGKVVLVGTAQGAGTPSQRMLVARLNADGMPDAGFGTNGVLTWVPDGSGNTSSHGRAVVMQGDGSLLIGGDSGSDVIVNRVTSAGVVDGSFAVRLPMGGETMLKAMIATGGKTLLGVTVNGRFPHGKMARLTAAGVLDTTFGPAGVVTLMELTELSSMVEDSQGRIIVGGWSAAFQGGIQEVMPIGAVYRYSPSGLWQAGIYPLMEGARVLVVRMGSNDDFYSLRQQNGASDELTVTKWSSAMLPADDFDPITWDLSAGRDSAAGMQVRADGRVLVGGVADGAFAVSRLVTGVGPDSGFGTQGTTTTSIGGDTARAAAMTVQMDGKVVLVGSAGADVRQIAVVRYHGGAQVPITPVAPTITQQPVDVTVGMDQSATFSVTATGSPRLSYQWYRDDQELVGRTAATLVLSGSEPLDYHGSKFKVTVTNPSGSVTSNEAQLTVFAPPVITSYPQGGNYYGGLPYTSGGIAVSVCVRGRPPLYVRWGGDWGYTDTITSSSGCSTHTCYPGDYVVIENADGTASAYGNVVDRSIRDLGVTISGGDQVLHVGDSTSLDSSAYWPANWGYSVPLTYQWKKGSTTLTGQKSTGLVSGFKPVSYGTAGSYAVTVKGPSWVYGPNTASASANIVVIEAPGNPLVKGSLNGQTSFSIGIAGSGYTCQWKKDGTSLNDDTRIQGSRTKKLTISHLAVGDAGNYQCEVSVGSSSASGRTTFLTMPGAPQQVPPMPTGTYYGTDGSTQCASVSVSSTGSFTGRLVMVGMMTGKTYSLPFSGTLRFDSTADFPFIATSRLALPASDGGPVTLTITIDEAGAMGLTGSVAVLGLRRNPWNSKSRPAKPYAGYYTAALGVGEWGFGYATFTVGAGGALTFAGRMPDGIAFTVPTFVDESGRIILYSWASGRRLSLGTLQLGGGTGPLYLYTKVTAATPLAWNVPGRIAGGGTYNIHYDGGSVGVVVSGARYLPPNYKPKGYLMPLSGPLVLNVPDAADNVDFSLEGTLDIGRLTHTHQATMSRLHTHPLRQYSTLTINPATGVFSGDVTDYADVYDEISGRYVRTTTLKRHLQGVVTHSDMDELIHGGMARGYTRWPVKLPDHFHEDRLVPVTTSAAFILKPHQS